METLFDLDSIEKAPEPKNFCGNCKHRERWLCGGSIIQYCGVRKSNRTFNGLLKIQAKNPACLAFEQEPNPLNIAPLYRKGYKKTGEPIKTN